MPISGTVQRYDRQGLGESLSDRIYNVDPQDTPLVSMIGVGPRAKQTLEEWQTDGFRAPASNAAVEGAQATYTTPSATVRVGNYTQILQGTASVSGTVEAIDKAGRKSEMAYQIMREGVGIRLDLEYAVTQAQAPAAGGAGTAREFASLNCWLKTNTDFGAGAGADPTYTSGVPSATRVDGTQRNFTETIGRAVFQSGYTNGAKFKVLMVGPVNKQNISANWTGIVTRNFDMSNVDPRPTAAIASVDIYVSDFGTVRVIPNRVQRERDAWYINPEFAHLRYLRTFRTKKLADLGDAEQKQILCEVTLAVLNEAALGGAFDLNTALF
jgi:hypothetical protein